MQSNYEYPRGNYEKKLYEIFLLPETKSKYICPSIITNLQIDFPEKKTVLFFFRGFKFSTGLSPNNTLLSPQKNKL